MVFFSECFKRQIALIRLEDQASMSTVYQVGGWAQERTAFFESQVAVIAYPLTCKVLISRMCEAFKSCKSQGHKELTPNAAQIMGHLENLIRFHFQIWLLCGSWIFSCRSVQRQTFLECESRTDVSCVKPWPRDFRELQADPFGGSNWICSYWVTCNLEISPVCDIFTRSRTARQYILITISSGVLLFAVVLESFWGY